jgi:DNA-binding NtrC family response regulator
VDSLEQLLRRKVAAEALIGLGEGIRRARVRVAEAIQGQLPVLIIGEPGTGRGEVARAIHEACVDRSRRIVVVECRTEVQDNLRSRLFGSLKSPGLLQATLGSTLVLDEVADLDPKLQHEFLSAWRKSEMGRIDATSIRVIALTRFDPSQHTARFDPELVRWLGTIRIDLPPLRERLEDLPMLAERMLRTIETRATLDPSAYRALLKHHWPGNLTELRGVLRKSAEIARHRPISDRDVVPMLIPPMPTDRQSFSLERDWLLEGLRRNRFRREETARYLRISRKTLYNKMVRYQLIEGSN